MQRLGIAGIAAYILLLCDATDQRCLETQTSTGRSAVMLQKEYEVKGTGLEIPVELTPDSGQAANRTKTSREEHGVTNFWKSILIAISTVLLLVILAVGAYAFPSSRC